MNSNFQQSLAQVLKSEGGFVDNPRDPGGATNKGVTLAVYQAFKRNQNLTADDLKNISDDDVQAIYKRKYWDLVQADFLPIGLDYCVFDAAVNSGPGRAAKWLQACVGTDQDGSIGPLTLDAVRKADKIELINDYCQRRLAYLQELDNWQYFGRGWENRVNYVKAVAPMMQL